MAKTIGSFLTSETPPTFCFSIPTTNTKPRRSFTTNTRRRKYICFRNIRHYPKSSSVVVQASSGPNSNEPNSSTSTAQDNLNYVLQLTIGSVLGAALIKYGSAAIPEITRPNITQALLMIATPVVVAILLLLKESKK